MFSQRKSFWKGRWPILIIVVFLGAGYWFSQREKLDPNPDLSRNYEPIIVNELPTVNHEKNSIEKSSEEEKSNFYLIKENNGEIEIYYYERAGEPTFIKGADIEFSLLSKEDQTLFSEGIIIETEEDLNELLQDFGS